MFASLLIANRGEIACRIMRTAARLGLRTIAVYSEADAEALHVAEADEAHLIGPPAATESYLRADAILEVAQQAGAEAVHPGYGFLAENAEFAEACAAAGLTFVGPPVDAIRLMGRKDEAKALMEQAGVPTVPGFDEGTQDAKTLAKEAARIGFPVMIKAVAGGGGKGMRRVGEADAFAAALEGARREAEAAFGDGRVLIEKCLDRPRHIEMQVFADGHGNALHLFERDCSLQRRHQKIIEESPAPGMPEGLRAAMGAAAVRAAQAVDYTGAGTVEFLVDGDPLEDGTPFYFLEMNTRLQVEHPVTEAVTGLDLVEWQLRVAAGEPLPLTQDDVTLTGHAVEARLYAEEPERGFLPSSGKLHALCWPDGAELRIDTGVRAGDVVTPFYDPMIAKIVAHGPDRDAALARLRAGLEQTVVAGPGSNLAFLHALLGHAEVAAGRVDTALVDREVESMIVTAPDGQAIRHGAAALLAAERDAIEARRARFASEAHSPWDRGDGFVLGTPRPQTLTLLVNNAPVEVAVTWAPGGPEIMLADHEAMPDDGGTPPQIVQADGAVFAVHAMRQTVLRLPDRTAAGADAGSAGGVVRAPMHGKLTKIFVTQGQTVEEGERLAILEAMKMEHVLHAPFAGTVDELAAAEGAQVEEADVVAIVSEAEAP